MDALGEREEPCCVIRVLKVDDALLALDRDRRCDTRSRQFPPRYDRDAEARSRTVRARSHTVADCGYRSRSVPGCLTTAFGACTEARSLAAVCEAFSRSARRQGRQQSDPRADRLAAKERLHQLVDTLNDREAEDALRLLVAELGMLIDTAPQGATDKDESGLATLPDGWGTTLTGRAQLGDRNVVESLPLVVARRRCRVRDRGRRASAPLHRAAQSHDRAPRRRCGRADAAPQAHTVR